MGVFKEYFTNKNLINDKNMKLQISKNHVAFLNIINSFLFRFYLLFIVNTDVDMKLSRLYVQISFFNFFLQKLMIFNLKKNKTISRYI